MRTNVVLVIVLTALTFCLWNECASRNVFIIITLKIISRYLRSQDNVCLRLYFILLIF